MSFYPASAAHRPSSVYAPAPPDAVNESNLTRIAKLVLPIFAGLVAFLILPFPLGLILGSAISVGGLFFGGYLSGDAIKKVFASIRPPRASLFNEEVNPPAPPVRTHTRVVGVQPSFGSSIVTPPPYVHVPPPGGFVPPPRYEEKGYVPIPRQHEAVNQGAPPPPYPTAMHQQGQIPREREQTAR